MNIDIHSFAIDGNEGIFEGMIKVWVWNDQQLKTVIKEVKKVIH